MSDDPNREAEGKAEPTVKRDPTGLPVGNQPDEAATEQAEAETEQQGSEKPTE